MSVSVIIPAHNEGPYLNRTIENIFSTAKGEIEVVVVLNGYDQLLYTPANVLYKNIKAINLKDNAGERVAMNVAARNASNTHLFRIDAHCDFSPEGWDVMLEEVTGERDITVAVLTALRIPWANAKKDEIERWVQSGKTAKDWIDWERLKGHWYGFAKLLPNFEAKWEKPNKDHNAYKTVEPNMAFTGCGFMIRKDFYEEIGGADESLPKMGAIGEEFATKAWLNDGKVQTRTDVMVGHIFGTGGYNTQGVIDARKALEAKYGDRYQEIADKFPQMPKLIRTNKTQERRTVTVDREDVHTTRDGTTGKVIKQVIERFRYVWVDDGSGLTDAEVCQKYAKQATKIGEQVFIADDNGDLKESKNEN